MTFLGMEKTRADQLSVKRHSTKRKCTPSAVTSLRDSLQPRALGKAQVLSTEDKLRELNIER